MENLKLVRKAKKKSRQLELQREMQQEATSVRYSSNLSYFDINQNYSEISEYNSTLEGYFVPLTLNL